MVVAVVGLAYAFWSQPSVVKRTIYLFILVVLVFFVVLALPGQVVGRLAELFTMVSQGDFHERDEIWASALTAFRDVPILGAGTGTFALAVERVLGEQQAPHNVYLSLLLELGVVGFFLLFLIQFYVVSQVLILRGREFSLWVTIIMQLFLIGMIANWEWRKQYWFFISLAAAQLQILGPMGYLGIMRKARND